MLNKILKIIWAYLKILLKGDLRLLKLVVNRDYNSYRVKKIFSPISSKLTVNQKDFRIII